MKLRRSLAVIVDWTLGDLGIAARHTVRHVLAGSYYMPRVGRFVLLRLARIKIDTANVFPGVTFMGPGHHLAVGKGSAINTGCFFDLEGTITIGLDCMFAGNVTILTSDHDLVDGVIQREPKSRPVTVGDRVWFGANVVVMPGVTIGDHVIVAAGAVVTKDCPSDGIYGGVPARRIKELEPTGP
jgi:maltose O-acetyltransferase